MASLGASFPSGTELATLVRLVLKEVSAAWF